MPLHLSKFLANKFRSLASIATAFFVISFPISMAPAFADSCPSVNPNSGYVSPRPYSFVDWSGCDLSGANLRSANLNYSKLIGANLSNADMTSINMTGANLTGANLTGANLSVYASLGSNFTNANLSYANFNQSELDMATLSNADLTGANFDNTKSSDIRGTPLALPPGYQINQGYLVGPKVNLSSANLSHAYLPGANFRGAWLSSIDFTQANLEGADFRDAYLWNATLDGANLTGASLYKGDLDGEGPSTWDYNVKATGTNFTNVDFRSAKLTFMQYSGAIFSGAKFGSTTCPNGWSSDDHVSARCFKKLGKAQSAIKISKSLKKGTSLHLTTLTAQGSKTLVVASGKCTVKIVSVNGKKKYRVAATNSKGSCLLTITAPARGEFRRLTQKITIRVT